MKIIKEQVFSFSERNKPLEGLTISEDLKCNQKASVFSLGDHTDISKESYSSESFLFCLYGKGRVSSQDMKKGEALIIKEGQLVSKETEQGFLYFEMQYRKDNSVVNEKIKKGEIFQLKDLLPYQEDKIINLDVIKTDKVKFALISMAKGTSLDAHRAPGEALLFVLDGKATLTYEGKDFILTEGDNFSFAKGGLHAITADSDFKFALLLEL